MLNYTVAWTWRGCLTYIGANIADLIGRTAEEIIEPNCSMEEIITPESLSLLKELCCEGPLDGIEVRVCPIWLRHKDGREICARLVATCQYDGGGRLAEAWGSLHACQYQYELNKLLLWLPRARADDVGAVEHLVGACA